MHSGDLDCSAAGWPCWLSGPRDISAVLSAVYLPIVSEGERSGSLSFSAVWYGAP